jgi:hypothetical protein
MPENDRLSGCLDEINVAFVEEETTPELLKARYSASSLVDDAVLLPHSL